MNFDRIVIVGSGNLGREVYAWFAGPYGDHLNAVFLDDFRQPHQKIDEYKPMQGDAVIVAIADPKGREAVYRRLDAKPGISFGGFCHHTFMCTVGPRFPQAVLMPLSLVSTGCTIGRALVLNTHSSIGHDCVVGDFVTMASHVGICGNVKIGNRVEFGVGAVVLPGVTIGDDAYIGAGAVVVRDVAPGARVFGNPARAFTPTISQPT